MCPMTNTLIYRVCCTFSVMGTTQVADMFMLDSFHPEFAEQTLNDRNSVAGSPVQERDISRQARTYKRRINSRTPGPIPPPPKRRSQRSEKARALPARQRLLAMRTSNRIFPRAAGSPAKQQNIGRQASSGITPRTSSPMALRVRRPRPSDRVRALQLRLR